MSQIDVTISNFERVQKSHIRVGGFPNSTSQIGHLLELCSAVLRKRPQARYRFSLICCLWAWKNEKVTHVQLVGLPLLFDPNVIAPIDRSFHKSKPKSKQRRRSKKHINIRTHTRRMRKKNALINYIFILCNAPSTKFFRQRLLRLSVGPSPPRRT